MWNRHKWGMNIDLYALYIVQVGVRAAGRYKTDSRLLQGRSTSLCQQTSSMSYTITWNPTALSSEQRRSAKSLYNCGRKTASHRWPPRPVITLQQLRCAGTKEKKKNHKTWPHSLHLNSWLAGTGSAWCFAAKQQAKQEAHAAGAVQSMQCHPKDTHIYIFK